MSGETHSLDAWSLARTRRRLAVLILLIVALGVTVKWACPSPWTEWGYRHGAGALYVVFWVLAIGWLRPGWPAWRAAALAGAATALLEWTQQGQVRWLDALRANRAGAALLGVTYDPADFAYYAAGALAGVVLLRAVAGPSRCKHRRPCPTT
jgi:hypothetical protein